MLLVLSPKISIFADDLIFDMSDFSFSWKLLTLRYFIDVTMPHRSFSNSSNKAICDGWLRDLNPYVFKVSGCWFSYYIYIYVEKFAMKLNFAKYINCCMMRSISMQNYQNPFPLQWGCRLRLKKSSRIYSKVEGYRSYANRS